MSDDFPPNSRYRNVSLMKRVAPDGTEEVYGARRIIPAMERYRALDHLRPASNMRIDDVAMDVYGDPEQYWRICDANGDAEPAQATGPEGRLLVIPMPLEVANDGNA
ncbi:hypothetical protein [Paraburkholderia caribensis]|uniref:hypothetical protein n=1 Tax=Paraburkholderia caribensis TaxID=75105 RepID=UPI001D07F1A8|nr:hypothetical protein [Paraburkholderia caribensis]